LAEVVIIGSGVVGSSTGKGFAAAGHAVRFVDIDAARVEALRARATRRRPPSTCPTGRRSSS